MPWHGRQGYQPKAAGGPTNGKTPVTDKAQIRTAAYRGEAPHRDIDSPPPEPT